MDRIASLDLLRGCAVLGMLLANIVVFGLPEAARWYPQFYSSVIDQTLFLATRVMVEQKFMSLFCLLFGFSIMALVHSQSGGRFGPAWKFFNRNLWLLIFGMLHFALLWEGDILRMYALCAFMLFLLTGLNPRTKYLLGIAALLIPVYNNISLQLQLNQLDPTTHRQFAALWQPSVADVDREIAGFQADYGDQLSQRLAKLWGPEAKDSARSLYTGAEGLAGISRAIGMMLIGMGLYAGGVLQGLRQRGFYLKAAALGLGVGWSLSCLGLVLHQTNGWQWQYSLFLGQVPDMLATPFIAAGYTALIVCWSKGLFATRWRAGISAVGRTAFSNYVLQSLLATSVFYGFGMGWFAQLSRVQLLLLVVLIWCAQITVSSLWLRHFHYGPLEWLWRSLSQYRCQVLIRRAAR